ncbi:phosphopantetheine-binding protein [Psychromonas sp. MME2]|uniref:acyl carrier protein n=1 Tax=unclassified Psychromonas TaxID=2614957 RepID=UPI00339D1D3F
MEQQSLLAYVCNALALRTEKYLEIDENTDLVKQLQLDSLHIMELILDVEDYYEISIPVSVLKNVKTVKDLVIQIEKITAGEI